VVGAGPAGLAASLQAKRHGLNFVTLEQEALGGTVAKYPRRKLVMTQPVSLPLHGQLQRTSYVKEELMKLWSDLAEQYRLPIRTGEELTGVNSNGNEGLVVTTRSGQYHARNVCLALGRRGTPRKLDVPGEELPKVAYSLIDAQSYQERKILVVGGGDSAVEAALGLAEQPGNEVTLSYRKKAFFRIKARNETRLHAAVQGGKLRCLFNSQVSEITTDAVQVKVTAEDEPERTETVPNDDVFVMAGGIPPFKLLEQCQVSFDPSDRDIPPPLAERGTGLLAALYTTLFLSIAIYVWVFLFKQYYGAVQVLRPLLDWHDWLRPSSIFGITCGVVATFLIFVNLFYLVRRIWLFSLPGSLATWMTSHVVTGVLALLLVFLHAAMSPNNTVGGHAFAGLAFLVVTGAIGRYFYSFVPRAANGQEVVLEELNSELASESTQWDRYGRGFGESTRQQLHALVAKGKWNGSFFERLYALLHTQRAARDIYRQLQRDGREQGLSPDQIDKILTLAHRAYRTALVSSHFEDLRAILNSWRFFHRWVALLMVLLAAVHIVMALQYGRLIP